MELVPFDWQGTRVRTVLREGAPWCVAADVCAVLGHTNPTVALRLLDEDEKAVIDPKESLGSSVTGGGAQMINVISESGLYALILRSRLPSARAFRRWVTGEVLPALRTRGAYALPDGAAAAGEIRG